MTQLEAFNCHLAFANFFVKEKKMNKHFSTSNKWLGVIGIMSDFFEDLFASLSPEYLDSIQQARQDYKNGEFYNHEQIFNL